MRQLPRTFTPHVPHLATTQFRNFRCISCRIPRPGTSRILGPDLSALPFIRTNNQERGRETGRKSSRCSDQHPGKPVSGLPFCNSRHTGCLSFPQCEIHRPAARSQKRRGTADLVQAPRLKTCPYYLPSIVKY